MKQHIVQFQRGQLRLHVAFKPRSYNRLVLEFTLCIYSQKVKPTARFDCIHREKPRKDVSAGNQCLLSAAHKNPEHRAVTDYMRLAEVTAGWRRASAQILNSYHNESPVSLLQEG